MNSSATITARVAAIQKMDTKALRQLWPKLFGCQAPKLNKVLLVQRLAFRVQELEFGSVSDKHKAKLERLQKVASQNRPLPKTRINRPPVGTRLVKEYDGTSHEVMVTREGFEYRGQVYRSLSKIACLITGSHWSGPQFFNLKGNNKAGKRDGSQNP